MSDNYDFSAAKGVEVSVATRGGKNVTYRVTEAGFEMAGINDEPPQSQRIWKSLVSVLEDHGTDEFTRAWAHKLCDFLYEQGDLDTDQDPGEIFDFYRSLDAKSVGGRGYLSRRWLVIKK